MAIGAFNNMALFQMLTPTRMEIGLLARLCQAIGRPSMEARDRWNCGVKGKRGSAIARPVRLGA